MDNETEIIKESILRLPKSLQDYVLDNTWSEKLKLIGQTNRLTDQQSTALKGEVFLVLAGIENYSDFTMNLRKNVVGVGYETILNTTNDIEKMIFSAVKSELIETEKINNEFEGKVGEDLSRDKVLNDIENPVPAKPTVQNPAGKNVVLDAQHNLPEQEKKILIPSTAVPSRGPMLGNFRNPPTTPTAQPIKPAQTTKSPYPVDPYREPLE